MSSFNHFVQKVCYTALNSYCQEGILYSLPCHILKVNVILLYFSCLTFYFFSNLFTSKLPLITFQVFTECCFLLTLPKPNATNSYFYIFKKKFWGVNFISHPYLLLPQKCPGRRCPGKCSVKEKGAFYSRWMLFQGLSVLTRHCKTPGSSSL